MAIRQLFDDQTIIAQHHVRAVTRASGSSFYWGMRILPKKKRDAIFAVYAFCRAVDDIADGEDDVENKRARLECWRRDIEKLYSTNTPDTSSPLLVALSAAIYTYKLDKNDFFDIHEFEEKMENKRKVRREKAKTNLETFME